MAASGWRRNRPEQQQREVSAVRHVEVAGLSLSAVGLGTWQFGAGEWGYGSTYATQIAPRIVHRSLELGINLVDTAEIYAFGRSERIVGEALAGRRDDAFVATKLFPVAPAGPVPGWRASGSLRRLGTGSIDLYQVHWPNPLVPDGLTASALRPLVDGGMVAHLGVSNYPLSRWRRLEQALGRPVVSNQVRYSLLDRRPETELLPHAVANDRLVIAYSPLGQGLLSGRYDADHLPRGLRARSPAFSAENLRRVAPLLDVLRTVAAGHDATCAQVALAWLLRRPHVVVIPGASSVEQAESNAAAAALELSDSEDAELTAASDAFVPVSGGAALVTAVRSRAATVARRARSVREGITS
jgi:aryl-alcohol dehydrogenase-like predicted oxidoreductase